jgi:hypothetical protein
VETLTHKFENKSLFEMWHDDFVNSSTYAILICHTSLVFDENVCDFGNYHNNLCHAFFKVSLFKFKCYDQFFWDKFSQCGKKDSKRIFCFFNEILTNVYIFLGIICKFLELTKLKKKSMVMMQEACK